MTENPMTGADATDASRPGTRSFAITPNDSADLDVGTRWFYVGVAGDVKITLVDDPPGHTGVVLKGMTVGMHRIAVRRVYATGTTATNLAGLA